MSTEHYASVRAVNPPAAGALGRWLLDKWQARLSESGRDFQTVARQMRKQGYPLDVARAVLLSDSRPIQRIGGHDSF